MAYLSLVAISRPPARLLRSTTLPRHKRSLSRPPTRPPILQRVHFRHRIAAVYMCRTYRAWGFPPMPACRASLQLLRTHLYVPLTSLLRRKYPQCLAKRGVLISHSPVPHITTSRSALAHGHRYTIMRTTASSTETAYSYFTSRPRPPTRAPHRRTPQHHRWSTRGPRGSLSRRPQSICLSTIFLLSASSTTTMTTGALHAIKRDVARRR